MSSQVQIHWSERLITEKEACAVTGIGRTKLRELECQGLFPQRVKDTKLGRKVLWRGREVKAWMDALGSNN